MECSPYSTPLQQGQVGTVTGLGRLAQPQGAALEEIRARRERLQERYLRPVADRPATTVAGSTMSR